MTATAAAGTSRGRIDKRRAIVGAAFAVFADRGYEQACVQEIADQAGVAKPTVYNHLNDKATLFRHAVEAAADTVAAECLDAVHRLRDPGDDLRATVTEVAHRLLHVCSGHRSHALRALTYAQAGQFPDLIDTVHERTSNQIADALADRFARLTLEGRLRPCDPALAADQFLALLTGPTERRSGLGTREVGVDDIRRIGDAAVDTFFRAYGGGEDGDKGKGKGDDTLRQRS